MLNALRHLLPGLSASRSQLKARLFFSVFIMFVGLLAIFLRPLPRMLAIEAILFQLTGAALLWWESISECSAIGIAVSEFKEFGRNSQTTGERVLDWVGILLGIMINILAVVTVLLQVAITMIPRGLDKTIIAELLMAVLAIVYFAMIFAGSQFLDKKFKQLGDSIRRAEDLKQQIKLARRALKTIGFTLIVVATLLQIIPTLVSFPSSI